ncbi:hypothetical protein CHS0354_014615 [Potamilus streckersoni]|uniref:ABC-2 type transporter transmembrane domain-containing protein n=1 Tax=Potamilus streckersoni TaxID=2493646 RepID=A0AAE0W1V7_9BIVA|nr:hypothetical protein CHS0354_014615 [Potamilus streckersoni]
MFDQVGILSGGQMVYFGASDYMLRYFSDQGYPCPQFANPLDYFVGLASIDRRNTESQEETAERVNKLVKNYASSDKYKETVFKIIEDTMKPSTRRQLLTARFTTVRRNQPSFFRALFTLLSRMTVHILRDRPSYMSRLLLLSLFVPFICVFLGHLKQTQSSVQDRIGLMYQSSQVPPYVSVLNAVALFPPLRDLYYRECRDGLYSTFTFMIAYCMHTLPFTLISSSIFSSVVYWVTGLNSTTSGFLIYSAVVFFLNFWGEMVTIVIMAIFLNPAIANSTSALIASASGLMASGFLRNLQDMIPVFQWFAWGNIFKYAGEILVANEFQNLVLTCTKNDTTCLPNGNSYLDLFYPDAVDNMRRNFWAIGTMVIATILISMAAFRIKGIPNLH